MCGPALSRDGERVAFVTWVGGRNIVVQDGEAGEEFDAISWPLALSADGKVVAYQARPGQEQLSHFSLAAEETVMQISTTGPWSLNYVHPEDDPRKAKSK